MLRQIGRIVKRTCACFVLGLVSVAAGVNAQDTIPPAGMTNERLEALIAKVDPTYTGQAGAWSFTLEGVGIQVMTDVAADRMRIVAPIVSTKALSKDELYRLMQANFDSALDARYAIANEVLWGTFLHPLSSLDEREFLLAIGQTTNVVISYGTTFSSGMFVFSGGDSEELQHGVLERLKRLFNSI